MDLGSDAKLELMTNLFNVGNDFEKNLNIGLEMPSFKDRNTSLALGVYLSNCAQDRVSLKQLTVININL